MYDFSKKTKQLIIRVSQDEHKLVKTEAAIRGMTISELMKQALAVYVRMYKV